MATFTIPIGPQHPALKEPGHFEFTLEGERVVAATMRLGYAHRGVEKACEARTWTQNLYLLERICGICSHVHAMAYSLGVEQLAGVAAPPRAQALRALVAELERIHSHLLWLGVTGHEGGFDTLFMMSWRDREIVLDLLEMLSGGRVHHAVNVLGGVRINVTPEHTDKLLQGLETLDTRAARYLALTDHDPLFTRRTQGIGVLGAAQAQALGVVGPTARASGARRDARLEAPYAAYGDCPPEWILDDAGDLAARVRVRVREIRESVRLARALLAALPPGDLTARMPRRIREGEAIVRVEAPRGDLFYFLSSAGGDVPERIKVRTPTLCNLGSVLKLVIGQMLADVPMLLVGVDPCFSCNDRLVTLRRGTDSDTWTWARLRAYAKEWYR